MAVAMARQTAPAVKIGGASVADGRQQEGGCVRPAKLFIGGITRHTTTKQLRDHFSQYGRVLDCVAMRQPDGRPRGFGYVTLDSPAAADRCLAEAQVVDGRVVDVKRAVPEGSGASPTGSLSMPGSLASTPTMADAARLGLAAPRSMLPHMHGWSEASSPYYGSAAHLGAGCLSDCHSPMAAEQAWMWGLGQTGPALATKPASEALDCVELLSRRAAGLGAAAPPPLMGCFVGDAASRSLPGSAIATPTVLSPMAAAPEAVGLPSTPVALSASAPEFVPAAASTAPDAPPAPEESTDAASSAAAGEDTTDEAKPQEITTEAAVPAKTPPGLSLRDVTNIVAASQDKKLACDIADKAGVSDGKDEKTTVAAPESREAETFAGAENLAAAPAPRPLVKKEGLTLLEIREDSSQEDDGDSLSSDGDMPDICIPSGVEHLSPEDLPSLGSAEHATGNCKRCNFFPKGRCQNGKECTFCHFPHDKRKPSRQEKRERRAAWLAQRDGGSTSEDAAATPTVQGNDESMESDDIQQTMPTAYSTLLPGLGAIPTTAQLPAPLSLPGQVHGHYKALAAGYPCAPPGLHPPALGMHEMWQPDEEVSPLRYGPPMPLRTMPVLSTVPLTPSTPQSVATSPTAASLKEMFGSEAPTPQISPTGAMMPDMSYSMMHHMSLQSQATMPMAVPAKVTAGKDMQTQTIGTQTMEDFACPACGELGDVTHCCESEAADAVSATPSPVTNAGGKRWAREELLRFRDSADRVTCGEAASMVVPIFKTVVVGSAEGN